MTGSDVRRLVVVVLLAATVVLVRCPAPAVVAGFDIGLAAIGFWISFLAIAAALVIPEWLAGLIPEET